MTFLTGVLTSVLAAVGYGDLLSFLIRITVIIASGTALYALLSRASAATRHLAAMATLVVLMAFPAANLFLPALRLPILPAAAARTFRAEAAPSISRADGRVSITPESSGGRATAERNVSFGRGPAARVPGYVVLLSLLVSSALILQLLVSFFAAAVTARRAWRIQDPDLRRELASARSRLGVSRSVDLRESPSIDVPVVVGLFRPVLILPVEARAWSREQKRIALLHEVAHVARFDSVGLLFVRFATCLFWFHPLVWNLARVARQECERCCDDLVLGAGERATDYASHLLAIVRTVAGRNNLSDVAPALAQRSNLETRLVSILRAGQRRGPISRSRLAGAVGLAALLLVAVAAVKVVAAPARVEKAVDLALETTRRRPSRDVRLVSREPLIELEAPGRVHRKSRPASDSNLELDLKEPTPVIAAAAAASAAPPAIYWISGSKFKDKSADRNESGIDYLRAGEYARAITAFEGEIRETGSVNAMYNLACAYSLRGDKSRAFTALQTAVENGFDNSGHMTEDEDLKLLQDDPHFYQLVRLAQDLQLFAGGRFGGMNDESDWRRALPRFERVTKDHPTIGRAWANLGYARLEAGDAKGGAAAYQKALDLGYQKPTTLYNLACCAARSGDINGAFTWLDRADKDGFELGEHAGSDTDLDAIRDDPRYRAMLEHWDAKMAKEHREKQKDEDREKSD